MQFKCERCEEVFINEDSLAVFSDVPILTERNDQNGTTYYGECPLWRNSISDGRTADILGRCSQPIRKDRIYVETGFGNNRI